MSHVTYRNIFSWIQQIRRHWSIRNLLSKQKKDSEGLGVQRGHALIGLRGRMTLICPKRAYVDIEQRY